jgi:hypothetical protein
MQAKTMTHSIVSFSESTHSQPDQVQSASFIIQPKLAIRLPRAAYSLSESLSDLRSIGVLARDEFLVLPIIREVADSIRTSE